MKRIEAQIQTDQKEVMPVATLYCQDLTAQLSTPGALALRKVELLEGEDFCAKAWQVL